MKAELRTGSWAKKRLGILEKAGREFNHGVGIFATSTFMFETSRSHCFFDARGHPRSLADKLQ